MRIASVGIKNFPSFADETITFNDYTCLVGPNGCGKSTVLCALNVFFRETANTATDLSQLDKEDFHQKNTAEPIEITLTFTELSTEAQKDFADYYRQGKLIVSAIAAFDENTGKAEVKQFGKRTGMPQFSEFFQAMGEGSKVAELRQIFATIEKEFPDLPAASTKDAMFTALRDYETAHPDQCTLLQSKDEFYGVSRGANRLAQYMQWVYVPAVKDATTEQLEAKNTALGKLLARTVRAKTNFDDAVKEFRTNAQDAYQALLDENQHVLQELSSSLQSRLAEWAHPDATLKLVWRQDPDKSVRVDSPLAHAIAGEGAFVGEPGRYGHGLQRSYLLAFLQELALIDDTPAPRLILGCEEPELYQHPPQARHLAAVLQKLSKSNSRIIVCSHSPLFVSGEGFENARMIRKSVEKKKSSVSHVSYQDISKAIAEASGERPLREEGVLAEINQALQPSLNEMFFASTLILVEGLEDADYITAYMHLLGKWDDYRRAGCYIVPVIVKSRLLQPLIIAKHMGIPTFVVFDAEGDKGDRGGRRAKHEKDNKVLLKLLGKPKEAPFPAAPVWGSGYAMWHSDIGAVVQDDIGADDWATFQQQADALYGHAGGLRTNAPHIGTTLELAWKAGKRSTNFEKLCREILNPASRVAI